MKNLAKTALFVLLFSVGLMSFALADVAYVAPLAYYAVPVIIIAAAIIAAVLIIRAVKNKKK